ncbi:MULTISPECIES: TetR/AcrR family transcriptional regulator [Rhodococcus]|uniref:TetR/AcrR family transcriptional regulator n=1 Tax=Rhodococcus TaxID=1827 RepID=UPI000B5A428F|nr:MULTISPECIES: TetR family transcriptional regulator [unclassified Rhodococcus (in: high G+C Gram-positive bacteria)]MXQ77320.1 TetR family transcriptional regulator [Rhodococcus rhodochrous]OWY80427.1 TetR family transcriptional regulator [Rhodococcus sp. BUPNP1]BDB59868.1 TetR family transcriptional regulator [Rhodococcus sp. RDE2]
MRSTAAGDDLTTRARIRDAAIRCIAAYGVGVPLRTIAAECGVSASLIVHHFGSRAGLKEHCDRYVLDGIRQAKSAVLDPRLGSDALHDQMEHIETYATTVAYLFRTLRAGGAAAADFLDRLVADTEAYLEEAVAAGTVQPSRFPSERARALISFSVGAVLMDLPGPDEYLDLETFPARLRSYTERLMLPMLELYTEPLLTDSTLLDAYLAVREAPPDS